MKNKRFKLMLAMLCMVTTLTGMIAVNPSAAYGTSTNPTNPSTEELRGVWISYLTWNQLPNDEAGFKIAVNQMFDNCKEWGMNAVFVHVRSHSDAMYSSSYYPWSKFASGSQGNSPGYDPLAYMIEAAHERNLQFHAWFNPYRITGYLMPWEEVSDQSPAKVWLKNSSERLVLKHDGAYYYNPSEKQVKDMVIQGVIEVVNNYDVDGIHFDDYFYPEIDNNDENRWFDKPEYLKSGAETDIAQWRRDQVSELIYGVNQAIKSSKPEIAFGVSPQGYVPNLRSDKNLFVDIDRWLSQEGFVDYIMPQLYWGFEPKNWSGQAASYAFEQNLNTWIDLKNQGNVKLYLGLGMYRAGKDIKDYNEVSEWLRHDDIIKRQVESGRKREQVLGYCFYSYDSFLEAEAQKEVDNLLSLFQ